MACRWQSPEPSLSDRARIGRGVSNFAGYVRTTASFIRPAVLSLACSMVCGAAHADPIGLQWPQPSPGAPIFITYSFSNLLDGTFLLSSPAELRSATEEALRLWASYAPLNFIEVPDSGPAASDTPYDAEGAPQIRIGHHVMSELAHAYYPGADGLAGDVHFATGIPWTVGVGHWNFLEAVTHELGHSLGLAHVVDEPAIMNPMYPSHRFEGLGTAFLFPSDIRSLQAIYGSGAGSLHSLDAAPEPGSFLLLGTGLAALAHLRRRRSGSR